MVDREKVKTLRLSDAEAAFLAAVEEEEGVSASDIMRRLLDGERRRRAATRSWLLRDLANAVTDGSEQLIEDVMLHRIVREAEERFADPGGIKVEQRRQERSHSEDGLIACVIAVLVFQSVRLKHDARPRVGISITRFPDRFSVGIGAHGDDRNRLIRFPINGETPPEVFGLLFEFALASANDKGRAIL
jgi:hypothetical protein